jgi:hypothetical protein
MKVYATAAGFAYPDLITEIATAESGGDSNIVNSIGAVGLMQILQPVHVKSHPTWTVAYLKNPLANMRAAKVLWDADIRAGGDGTGPWLDSKNKGNGGGWGKSAAYARYKNGTVEQAGLPNPGDLLKDFLDGFGNGLDQATPDIPGVGGLKDLTDLGVNFAKWASNPRSWVNAGYVLIGGVIIVVALSATVRGAVVSQVAGIGNKVLKK